MRAILPGSPRLAIQYSMVLVFYSNVKRPYIYEPTYYLLFTFYFFYTYSITQLPGYYLFQSLNHPVSQSLHLQVS